MNAFQKRIPAPERLVRLVTLKGVGEFLFRTLNIAPTVTSAGDGAG